MGTLAGTFCLDKCALFSFYYYFFFFNFLNCLESLELGDLLNLIKNKIKKARHFIYSSSTETTHRIISHSASIRIVFVWGQLFIMSMQLMPTTVGVIVCVHLKYQRGKEYIKLSLRKMWSQFLETTLCFWIRKNQEVVFKWHTRSHPCQTLVLT